MLVLVMPIFIVHFSSNILANKTKSCTDYLGHSNGNDNNDKSSVSNWGEDDDTNDGLLSRTNSSNNNNCTDNITNDLKPSVISEPKTPEEGIFPGPDQLAQQYCK
jgi:hypothetical protein